MKAKLRIYGCQVPLAWVYNTDAEAVVTEQKAEGG